MFPPLVFYVNLFAKNVLKKVGYPGRRIGSNLLLFLPYHIEEPIKALFVT